MARGGRVRVITTTYMGATEKRAVDELVALGAEVRVAFDARTTKLHAKAWLLERASGLTTAFVGSSNLSHTRAVRRAGVERPAVLDRRGARDRPGADDVREPLGVRALRAVRPGRQRRASWSRRCGSTTAARSGEASTISFAGLDVRPYPHQQRMLEALDDRARAARPSSQSRRGRDRDRQDRRRCARLPAARRPARARPVAAVRCPPRARSCRQSLATYRAVLRDGAFGEIHGGGRDRRRTARLRDDPVAARGRDSSRSPRTRSTSSSSTSSTTPRPRPTTGCSTTSRRESYWG